MGLLMKVNNGLRSTAVRRLEALFSIGAADSIVEVVSGCLNGNEMIIFSGREKRLVSVSEQP